jgi:two-component system sensor histidine kinase/response regulator
MTANALKGDAEECLAAGMDGYILKPIRAAKLFATMDDAVYGDGKASVIDTPEKIRQPG